MVVVIEILRSYLPNQTSRVTVHLLSCYYHSVCLTRESLISFEKVVFLSNKEPVPPLCGASFSSECDQNVTASLDNSSFLIATISSGVSFDNQSFDCLCECWAVDSSGTYQANLVVYVQPLLVATSSSLQQWHEFVSLSTVPLDPSVMWSRRTSRRGGYTNVIL